MTALQWEWRGSLPYAQAWAEQHSRRDAIIAGQDTEAIWLLEHRPAVITTGKRVVEDLPTPAELARQGITLHRTERGGLATWHGPGQLVAYLMIRAQKRRLGVKGMVCAVENAIIAWLSEQGITAGRHTGHTGVWSGNDKICALGLHFRRGVSMHGLALNLAPDLNQFGLITPCGIHDGGITSVLALTGKKLLPKEVAPAIGVHLVDALTTDS